MDAGMSVHNHDHGPVLSRLHIMQLNIHTLHNSLPRSLCPISVNMFLNLYLIQPIFLIHTPAWIALYWCPVGSSSIHTVHVHLPLRDLLVASLNTSHANHEWLSLLWA